MLLRRILDNLKTQNWVAISLDLIVVIVGIFLAFQVDRWNEDRKSQLVERERIDALVAEFDKNRSDLKSSISRLERVMSSAISLLSLSSPEIESMDHDEFYMLMAGVDSNPTFQASRSTFDLLTATGEIDAISDSELKRQLAEFYTRSDWTLNRDRQIAQRVSAFEPYVKRALDHNALMRKIHPADTVQMPIARPENQFRQVVGTVEFDAEISAKWHTARDYRSQLNTLHELALEISGALQQSNTTAD